MTTHEVVLLAPWATVGAFYSFSILVQIKEAWTKSEFMARFLCQIFILSTKMSLRISHVSSGVSNVPGLDSDVSCSFSAPAYQRAAPSV